MCRLFLVTCACLAILFGGFGLYMMPGLVQDKIEQRMQLKIGTKNFDRFTRIPIPLTVKFYLFNISNSEQVLAGLERPQFQEVGPFVYKQWRRRDVVDITDNNRKITYREFKTFYSEWPAHDTSSLELDLEVGGPRAKSSPNDTSHSTPKTIRMLNPKLHNVTIINMPLLAVLDKLAQLEGSGLKRSLAVRVVSRLMGEGKETIIITKPANEILFDGYKFSFMEAASDLITDTLGFNFDSPLAKNKFGFFYTKNGTWDRREAGEMTIFTGRNESMNNFMMVDNWNGLKQLNVWHKNTEAGNRCNEIRGTDGSQFHPGVSRDQVLDIFSPMICTSIYIKYKEDVSVRDIPLLRFGTPPDVFAAPKKSPRNACYCTLKSSSGSAASMGADYHKSQLLSSSSGPSGQSNAHGRHQKLPRSTRITDGRCYIDGLMDLSLCQKGAPIAASAPHFYNADPMLAMAAGLKPQRELHETYLDIEPMTGAVMRAASRAQLNALVERAALDVVDPNLIGHMTPMVAPLLWLEEAAEIDEKSSTEFKSQLLDTVNKAKRTFYSAIAAGSLLLVVISLHFWYFTCYMIDTSARAHKANQSNNRPKRTPQRPPRRPGQKSRRPPGPSDGSQRSQNLRAQTRLIGLDDKSNSAGAVAAVATAAVVLGAADAAATANQRRMRDGESWRTRRADYEDEDELSKRGLVESEWLNQGLNSRSSAERSASPMVSTSSAHSGADSPPLPSELEGGGGGGGE